MCRLWLGAGSLPGLCAAPAGRTAGAPARPGRPAAVHRAAGRAAGLGLGVVAGADQAAVCRVRGGAGPSPPLVSAAAGLGAEAPGIPGSPAAVNDKWLDAAHISSKQNILYVELRVQTSQIK